MRQEQISVANCQFRLLILCCVPTQSVHPLLLPEEQGSSLISVFLVAALSSYLYYYALLAWVCLPNVSVYCCADHGCDCGDAVAHDAPWIVPDRSCFGAVAHRLSWNPSCVGCLCVAFFVCVMKLFCVFSCVYVCVCVFCVCGPPHCPCNCRCCLIDRWSCDCPLPCSCSWSKISPYLSLSLGL